MDILEEIKKEHDEFRELFSVIKDSHGKKKRKNFEKLYTQVIGHHESEEHVLFPDVKEQSNQEGEHIVREMIEEHSLIAYQLSVLEKTPVSNETWDAKLSVLKEVLTHHLDEEEKELFNQAKRVLNEDVLKEKYEVFEDVMKKYKEEKAKELEN